MSYTYTTIATVPEHTIKAICDELINNTIHNIIGVDVDLTDDQLILIKEHMIDVRDSICTDNHMDVDGWCLTKDQITDIASNLAVYSKIGAIKAFRSATGAGLKEAKDYLEKFCIGYIKDSGPKAASNFTAAFNK